MVFSSELNDDESLGRWLRFRILGESRNWRLMFSARFPQAPLFLNQFKIRGFMHKVVFLGKSLQKFT